MLRWGHRPPLPACARFGDLRLKSWPRWLGDAGLAVERGGPRVRMDASLPLRGLFRMPVSGCDDREARDPWTFPRPWEMGLFRDPGLSLALGVHYAGCRSTEILLISGVRRW